MNKKLIVIAAAFFVSLCNYSQLISSLQEANADSSSSWNPFDYSIYKTASQYIDDYPAQEDTTIYAEFSWNKVPRWLAIRSGSVFSDEDINTIANNHQMVMLEKYNSQGTSSTEKGALAAAARLKAVNPDIKILFYWNTWINYGGYDANTEYEANKWDWSDLKTGADGQDTLDLFKDLYYTYNYDSPGLRAWWVKIALNMVNNDLIDGVFIDKVHSYEGVYFVDGEPSNNYIKMLDSLSLLLPEGKIFFGNILRNERWGGARGHMNYADGSYWERWEYQYRYTDPRQTEADARCVNMQLAREAVLKGKIVNFMGGGETTAIRPTEAEENEANMRGFLREDVQFPLAVYLIIADTNAYFNYKESVDTDDEDWKWDASFLEELNRPLGKPLGDPTKDGYIYTRSYEKVDVWVNVETTEAKLTWKDYPDFLKLKIVVRDSSTNAVLPDARIAVEDLNRLTDANGVLQFGLDSGSYSISISKSEYETKTETYVFSSDTTLTVYLETKPFDDGTNDEISGYYQVTKKNASSFCLYAGDADLVQEGNQLSLYPYEEADPNTVWVEYDRGDGYYSYQLFNTNYWIDGGNGGANSQAVFLSQWDADSYDQYWQKVVSDTGYVRLQKRDVEFVINGGSGGSVGQLVNLWKSSAISANLEWMFHPVFENPVALSITIVDSITNETLSGVEIVFNKETKQTGDSGVVSYSDLDVPAKLAYTLSKEGYVAKVGSIQVLKDDSIVLRMSPVPEMVSLTLTVVDSISNLALSGVEVSLHNETKQTDANGGVNFSDLEVANSFTYTLSKEGYVSKEGSIQVTKTDSITLSMAPVLSGIEEKIAQGVNIYPNPTSSFLMIETNKGMSRVDVFNVDGKLITSQIISGASFKLTLPEVGQSLLFVNVVLKDGSVISKRIIVE